MMMTENEISLKQQKKIEYQGDNPLVTDIICGECAETFGSEYDFNIHMPAHAVSVGIKCEKCDFTSESNVDIESHIQTVHMSLKVDLKEDDLQTIKCNKCDYKCRYNIQLKKHIKIHEPHAKYNCKKCDFSTEFVASTWEHKLTDHPEESDNISAKESENFILKIVAEQMTSLSEDVYSLKRDTKDKDALVAITKALDTCIENLKNDNNEKCKVL